MEKAMLETHTKQPTDEVPTAQETDRVLGSSSQEEPGEGSHELECIARWLKQTKFKKTIIGGVDEVDVWKKIGELNALYVAALNAERVRYNTLIEHYRLECIQTARQESEIEQAGAAESYPAGSSRKKEGDKKLYDR